MIRSEFDEDEGRHYLWRTWKEKYDDSIVPQEVVAAYRAHIMQLKPRKGFIPNEIPGVTAELLKLPGFSFEREGTVELYRSCPSVMEPRDMTGAQIVGENEEPRIYDFLKETGLIGENREDLRRIFAPGGYHVFLTEKGRDVAFGSINADNDGSAWLSYIAVLETERRRGLGRRIMEILLVEADKASIKKILLSTGAGNTAAMRLFGKFGFTPSAPPLVWVKFDLPD